LAGAGIEGPSQATGAGVGSLGAIASIADSVMKGRWSADRRKLIRESRVQVGNVLMEAIRAAEQKPSVLVQGSAVGYYGTDSSDTPITEDHGAGNDFLAKVCFDWEISTAPASRMGIRRPVVRTGIVLSNEGGAFPRLKLPFSFFAGGKLGSGEQWYPWIHIDDEVRAIQFVLENEGADGPFNLSAPNPVRNEELAETLGDVMGRPSAIPAPGFAMKAAFGEMATIVLDGQKAVPQKLLDMGFEFKYNTIEEALAQLTGKTAPKKTDEKTAVPA
jgi:uncharacterized protein (TIGR01777 family)